MPKFLHTSRHHLGSHRQTLGLVLACVTVISLALFGAIDPAGAQPPTKATGDSGTRPAQSSDSTSTTVWIIQRSALAQTRAETFRKGLRDALGPPSGNHLVGKQGLATRVSQRPATVPGCLFGVESCDSPIHVTLDHLGIDTLIRLEVYPADDGGTTDLIRATYTLVDNTGEPRRTAEVSAKGARKLAFAIVRDIFDATATLRVNSTPEGAEVIFDGEPIGTTPVEQRVPIGPHEYRVELDAYEPASGSVELTANSTETVEVTLEPKPAMLSVQGAPANAIVEIDGETRGGGRDPIELTPGAHTLVVRAQGYTPMEREIEAKPGETLQVTAPLAPESAWLKDIATDEIAANRYILRASGSLGIHRTTYRDARTRISGGQLEFAGFRNDQGLRPLADPVRRTAIPFGAQLDFGYSGRNFGLLVASMTYSGASMNRKAELIRRTDAGRETVTATVEGVRRFQVRPLQIRYRHFFKNFVPTIEAGTGISFQWVAVRPEDTDERVMLHNTDPFWTVGAGAQYFFTPRLFILGRYNVQHYFDAERGIEHILNIGGGMTFPNIFGFEPRPPEKLD